MSLQPLNHVLSNLEKQKSWRSRRQFRQILAIWPKAVGYAVARQTKPVGLQRQVLQVATASSAWAQTLAFERRSIIEKLNAELPMPIADIRFSTAQWRSPENQRISSLTSEQTRLWQAHPSWISTQNSTSDESPSPLNLKTQDPIEAFQQWANRIQTRALHQPVCPSCHCSCPAGELKRWSACAICAAKRW